MNDSATIEQVSTIRGKLIDYLSLERNVSLASAAVFILGLGGLSLYRWLRGRKPADRDRSELYLAQIVLTVSVLLAGATILVHVINAYAVEDRDVITLTAVVLAVLLFLLWRARLAPPWTTELLGILSEPRGALRSIQRKQSGEPPS